MHTFAPFVGNIGSTTILPRIISKKRGSMWQTRTTSKSINEDTRPVMDMHGNYRVSCPMNHLHFTPRVGNTVLNHPWRQFHYRLPTKLLEFAVKDPGFLWGGGGQHTILSKFPENCMKLKEF